MCSYMCRKVGNEFVKLYKMIYAKKELTEQGRQEAHRLLNVMSKRQILKLSMKAMDEKVAENESTQ